MSLVNVPTRGYPTGYQQVGVLIEENSNGENKLLPLFGEQTYPGSRQWRYYTSSDGYQSVKLPIPKTETVKIVMDAMKYMKDKM